MTRLFHMFILVLALSLASMPFGMARMMNGHAARGEAHQHHQTQQKSAPHATFIVCAACVGVNALPEAMPVRLPTVETIALGEFSAPDGLDSIPLLPPPRS